ncbi:hypothetical protein SteCoe_791 [Stentor coeruleus]|uniref:Uncharacterized protein n=1 Tax=Stentor coeruleus TaxID=5963 RepID=A0A1R2D385_9CILI|nr:hypothetical protein SteCoe_791 [Stentor coeruleus]
MKNSGFYSYHSDNYLFQALLGILVCFYAILSIVICLRLKFPMARLFKKQIKAFLIVFFLICIRKFYLVRPIQIYWYKTKFSTKFAVLLGNLIAFLHLEICFLYTYLTSYFYFSFKEGLGGAKRDKNIQIVFIVLLCFTLLFLFAIIILFIYYDQEYIFENYAFLTCVVWVFAPFIIGFSAMTLIKSSSKIFTLDVLKGIKQRSYLFIFYTIFGFITVAITDYILNNSENDTVKYFLYRSMFYFLNYLIIDIIAIGILLLRNYKLKNNTETMIAEAANELILGSSIFEQKAEETRKFSINW